MNRPLRVLVCSGNLGNALPDPDSISAWLPHDGCYSEVVQNQEYPLPNATERDSLFRDLGLPPMKVSTTSCSMRSGKEKRNNGSATTTAADPTRNETDDDYFDIIVVGMQEATFEVKEEKNGGGTTTEQKDVLPFVQPLIERAQKEIRKTTKKGFATVTTLTGSTDHTSSSSGKRNINNVLVPEWLKAQDSSLLHQLLVDRCPSYDFAIRFQRGEMRLEILVRRDLEAQVLSVRAQNTGLVNLAANKGGIVGELLVCGTTRLTFCTAHLEAHEGNEKYWNRCQMLTDIFSGTADDSNPGVKLDQTLKSHYCFVLGDLNFRTEIDPSLDKDTHHEQTMKLVQEQDWRALNIHDELFRALREKDMAVGFETLPCYFPPTFKVERQDGFVYKNQRRPSYTDRIMWRCNDQLQGRVVPTAYEPIVHFTTSDHKPIRGAFEIQLNQRVRLREPRMRRRQSLRALRGLSVMNMRHDHSSAPQQTLHIFVNNLRCTFYKKRKYKAKDAETSTLRMKGPASLRQSETPTLATLPDDVAKPDTFMAFLSYPKSLVKAERSTWQKFEGLFRGAAELRTEVKEDGSIIRTAGGWPRTKKLLSTTDPDWSNEGEIHLKVKSHNKHGVPLDHTGSILYFCAFNVVANLDLTLIGTFAMNLGMLCSKASTARRSQLTARSSVYLKDEAMSDMTSFEIDQPLLKNGRETGWINCDIDACWLDNAVNPQKIKSLKHDAKQKRLSRRRNKKK